LWKEGEGVFLVLRDRTTTLPLARFFIYSNKREWLFSAFPRLFFFSLKKSGKISEIYVSILRAL
ncbi:hypothetical protein, partial [uncultured Dubosiella sp.]|uniref:hypothetical protein n=1 Tax=uncultured Dubosiella sp. TaxID=1937011 RepID=UPI0025B331FE